MDSIIVSIEDLISNPGSGLLPEAKDEELNLRYFSNLLKTSYIYPSQLAKAIVARMEQESSILSHDLVFANRAKVLYGWKTATLLIDETNFDHRFSVLLRSEMLRPSLWLRSTMLYLLCTALFRRFSDEILTCIKNKEKGVKLNSALTSLISLWKRCGDYQDPGLLGSPYRELVLAALTLFVRSLIFKFKSELIFRSPEFCVFFRYPEVKLSDEELAPFVNRVKNVLLSIPIISIFDFDRSSPSTKVGSLSDSKEYIVGSDPRKMDKTEDNYSDIESIYLTSNEVCALLGISHATLSRVTHRGDLHIKLKNKSSYLYFRSEVEKYKKLNSF